MHVHATVAGVEILVVGVEMHARARATGKATPAAIYSYSRNALPVLVRDGCRGLEFTLCAWVATAARRPRLGCYDGDAGGWLLRALCD